MWYRCELCEAGEAGRAVGGKVAGFPPVAHRGEQPAYPLAGRDAKGPYVATGERKHRRCPVASKVAELGQPATRHFPFCRQQHYQVAIASDAKPINRSTLGSCIRLRIERPGRGKAMKPIAPCIRKAQTRGERHGTFAVDFDERGQTPQLINLRLDLDQPSQSIEAARL